MRAKKKMQPVLLSSAWSLKTECESNPEYVIARRQLTEWKNQRPRKYDRNRNLLVRRLV